MNRGAADRPWAHQVVLWPVEHPWVMLATAFVCAVLSLISISRIRPDVSIATMFAKDDPAAAALSHVLEDFPASEQLIVLATLPDASPSPDPQRLIAFAERFEGAVHARPQVEKLTDGILYRADNQSREFVEKVIGPAALFYLDEHSFDAARHRLTKDEIERQIAQDRSLLATPGPAAAAFAKQVKLDPLRLHEFIMDRLAGQRPFHTYQNGDEFVSPDGRSLLIRVIGREPPSNLDFCQALTHGIKDAAQSANADGLKLEYAGAYPIAAKSQESIRRDMIESTIGSVLLLQALFLIAYRSPFRLFALAFGPVALGIFLGFGAYGVISKTVTPFTAVLGAILAGMGIDYSIQYISQYESRRGGGASARAAAADAAIVMGPAVLAAWATSVVGFVAIGWSRVQAMRDFALLGTLGLTGTFVCAVAVLPAILMLTDGRPEIGAISRIRFGAERLVDSLSHRWRFWVAASLVIFVAALAVIARSGGGVLPLESDLTVMHPRPNPAIEAQYHIAERFGISPDSMMVYLHAADPKQLLELAYDVNERLRQPSVRGAGIVNTFGLATLLPDPRIVPQRVAAVSAVNPERVVSDFESALTTNGFSPQAFEQYARFLTFLLNQRSVPTVESLIGYPRIAETILPASSQRGAPVNEAITLVFVDGSLNLDRDRVARDKVIHTVREALSDLSGATVTGLGVVSRDTEQTVRRELPRLILIAVVIVAAYLAVHFRSLTNALLSLIPTVFGMVVAVAILRLLGQKLNMINLIAVPLLIGIDVDYGIFLVSLARRKRVQVGDDSARHMGPVLHAVFMCATATILGYVSLVWASVPAERSLGIAAAVGIGACLGGVVFLLVPIVSRVARRVC